MKRISTRIIHPTMRELLSFATSDSKVAQEYEKYLKYLNRQLFGFELQGVFFACTCIGIEIISLKECVMKHIAVSSERRGKGIGSKMIKFLSKQYLFITAETDKDAVDFYRKYAFLLTSLGEKYLGVERFLGEYRNEIIKIWI